MYLAFLLALKRRAHLYMTARPASVASVALSASPPSSVLERHLIERKEQLAAYFQHTRLLHVVEFFVTQLQERYAEARQVPLDPYAPLLALLRLAEISAPSLLDAIALNAPQPSLTVFDPLAETSEKTPTPLKMPPELQITTRSRLSASTPIIWSFRSLLERLSVQAVEMKAIYERFSSYLRENETQDEGIRVQTVSAVVGSAVWTRARPVSADDSLNLPLHVEIERHVIVFSDQLEPAMTVFARHLLRLLYEASSSVTQATLRQVIPCTGLTMSDTKKTTRWTMERATANRSAFIAAVKTTLVADGSFSWDTWFGNTTLSSDEDTESLLVRCTTSFFFHFHATTASTTKSKASIATHRSFVAGSRILHSGVLFHAPSAAALALQLHFHRQHQQSTAARIDSREDKLSLDSLLVWVTEKTQSPAECRHWLDFFSTAFAYRLRMLLSAVATIHSALEAAVTSGMDEVGALERTTGTITTLVADLQRLRDDANVGRASSLLYGVESLLNEQVMDLAAPSTSPAALIETLKNARELLQWLTGAATRDFKELVVFKSKKSLLTDWPAADLRPDIQCALEQRRYPPSVTAEAVWGQYWIDTQLDVALESAAMQTVAFALPPNPFISFSRHIRAFAMRYHSTKPQFSSTQVDETAPIISAPLQRSSGLLVLHGNASQPALVCMNGQILQQASADQVRNAHLWLETQQIYCKTSYRPSKASYAARIFPSLVLCRPNEYASTACRLMWHHDVVEHIVIEGSDEAQARWIFANAVRRDVERLGSMATSTTAMTPITMNLLGPTCETLTSVELEDIATFEQLVQEATASQCTLQLSFSWLDGSDKSMAVIRLISKTYVFHFVSTALDKAQANQIGLSDTNLFRLWRFGVFFSEETAVIALTKGRDELFSIPKERLTSFAMRAVQQNDGMLLHELRVIDPRDRIAGESAFGAFVRTHSDLYHLLDLPQLTPHKSTMSAMTMTSTSSSAVHRASEGSVMDRDVLPELRIKNFVSSANLGMRFDLTSLIAKSHRKAELVPKKNCLLMKIAHPRATAMLFANGKLVCSGADSEDGIKTAARKFTQIIQKMDHPGVNLIDFKIQNVVGTCDVGFRVLIEELSFAHSAYCTYEPELYPALIYRLEKPKVKILVFVSGKVVFTGTKDQRELHSACQAIYPILKQFRDVKRQAESHGDDDVVGFNDDDGDEDMHDMNAMDEEANGE
ncbi:hypothetical protein Poli38472_004245 [Pythium oligandrum]|uniref:TATA-box-binding protein n=1 Tax=Pythium oligandrum TaxID=41045 RepID=A0A8K1FJW2_PYTOL|nr:hypothetical protein Poli38472_004245 [Pythium oligandrum]|eukprot:TMW66480.1 hypothetical protein Poli38472_004245 [Pythium oligandrum]